MRSAFSAFVLTYALAALSNAAEVEAEASDHRESMCSMAVKQL